MEPSRTITKIEKQLHHEGRVSIYVDEEYAFSLTYDQLLESKLKKGSLLDEEQIEEFAKLSDFGKLRSRALEWVMIRPRAERELRDYLFKKKADKQSIDDLVEELKGKKYLDDEHFAKWLFELRRRKNKSIREIRAELQKKGVLPVTIQNIVTELTDSSGDEESLKSLINKLRNRPRYADDKKLIPYLLSKGFSYSDIKSALDSLTQEG